MKKYFLLSSAVLGVLLLVGCSVDQTPFGPKLDASLHTLGTTNRAFHFTGVGVLDGFQGTEYSAAYQQFPYTNQPDKHGDGDVQNLDGENLFIWMTNARRSHGGGWFWGGFFCPFSGPTNLLGSPGEFEEWALDMKIRSATTNELANAVPRPMNFQIIASNAASGTKGTLTYISPTPIPLIFTEYLLRKSDFTLSGSMSSADEVLSHVQKIEFMLDNVQIADLDTFGFLVDYILVGFK